jgi:uncharacterized protein YwgA
MTRYQLAKLVQWAGTLEGRKRLQKVVFLLKAAGYPARGAEFGLHHFGPYSREIAERVDEMTSLQLLQEECIGGPPRQQFNYNLTDEAKARLATVEATPRGKALADEIASFEAQAKELLGKDVRELEVAATMVFFYQQRADWPCAVAETCGFKSLSADSPLVPRAEALARSVLRC